MQDIRFRLANPSDAARIAALHAASWRSAYRGIMPDTYLDEEIDTERETLWRARLNSPANDRLCVWLGEHGAELAGFACLLLDEEPFWGACLDNLHVQPELRGHGLGRQLFGRAVRWLLTVEPDWPIYLWVFEANEGARRLYDALRGQVVERTIKDLPGNARIPSLRYVWRDAVALLTELDCDSRSRHSGNEA